VQGLYAEGLIEMHMEIGHVAEACDPLRMSQHTRPVYVIDYTDSTVASPSAYDSPYLRVIYGLLNIIEPLPVRTCILMVREAHCFAQAYLQSPLLKNTDRRGHLLSGDAARSAEKYNGIT
jgi:hypothetical protein